MAYRQPSNGYSGNDGSTAMDKQTHIIEHLATFSVSRDRGIIYPADGMRRLLQLEKTNGIWSQKMQLCLDDSWVLIMDYETGTEMERFPANSIQEPTAFTNQDPMAMYNNILVFIVTNSNPNLPPEMHIFQCQSISAQDLTEDLEQFRLGKTLTRNHKSLVPPPIHKPPQNIINPSRDHHNHAMTYRSDSELTANNDDTSSTTSEKYERDVAILNHCFDDIEKFIARLQHAAAAARELERRQKSRKNRKRDMGDGMLTMRTKPPPDKEFTDIFQKFKLSFNLLAKLKAHIHDPNAPELVHFLFTPLALIVEASHDMYFDLHLPHNVVSPLLTREAINLLMNCVTSKETELWHSLGNAWSVPRDQYSGHVQPYHPTFMDGWSPEVPIVDHLDTSMDNQKYQDTMDGPYGGDYHDYGPPPQEARMYHQDKDLSPTMGDSTKSDISVDSIELKGGVVGVDDRGYNRNQDSFLDELQARGAHVVQVTYPRTANNDKELTVVRGEILEILDDSRKWWKARNSKGKVAHVPHTIVTQYIFHNPLYRTDKAHRPESPVEAQRGHSSGGMDHMQPAKNTDWIINERIGVPPPPPAPMPGAGAVPPPPPPPPPPGGATLPRTTPKAPAMPTSSEPNTPTPTLKRSPSRSSIHSVYQEELTQVLSNVRQRNQFKNHFEVKQTPEVFIYSKSTPADVQDWLQRKGFDQKLCKRMDVNGQSLFEFKKDDLTKIFGVKEGTRLFSQLNIQKSMSGWKTVRSTELENVLAKFRQKIDVDKEED